MRIYVSHSIRGALPLAPGETIEDRCRQNNKLACIAGTILRRKYPAVHWYVPGEYDDFPIKALAMGLLTVDELLDIDCEIVRECQGVLFINWEGQYSSGMLRELRFARNHNIPVLSIEPTPRKPWGDRVAAILETLDLNWKLFGLEYPDAVVPPDPRNFCFPVS